MLEAVILAAVTLPVALTTAYWVCLIVGGGLLVFSAFGGDSSDADVSVDVGADVDADFDADFSGDVDADFAADVHADFDAGADVGAHGHDMGDAHGAVAGLSTWFSVRFVVFMMVVFGMVGVVLTYLSGLPTMTTLWAAVAGGVVIGQLVHQLFRYIRRSGADSAPRPQDYVNKLALVTIPIEHPRRGEVAMMVRNTRRALPAEASGQERHFHKGQHVMVVSYRAGVLRVVSREEFENKYRFKQGEHA